MIHILTDGDDASKRAHSLVDILLGRLEFGINIITSEHLPGVNYYGVSGSTFMKLTVYFMPFCLLGKIAISVDAVWTVPRFCINASE